MGIRLIASHSGVCLSKVPKLFGHISGDIILFVSSKRRRLEARNFYCYSLCNILKDQLYRISRSEFYEWLFGPEKFSGLSRNGPLGHICNSNNWREEKKLLLVLTQVTRRSCWCTKQWQNVAHVLHNNNIEFLKDFFYYCFVQQHGCRDVTWKPRIQVPI